jgi:hypothetical protein
MIWSMLNPWWVAILLGALLIITLRLVRAHVAGKAVLLAGALLSLVLAGYLAWLNFGFSTALVLAWLIGVALALLLNDFIFALPRGVFYVSSKDRFIFPGSVCSFILALGLAALYYSVKVGQLWTMPWSNWPYLSYVVTVLYGFLGGMFVSLFLEALRARTERSIGHSFNNNNKVYWTVAK